MFQMFLDVCCMFTPKLGMNTFPMLQASAVARGPKAAIWSDDVVS